MSFVKREYVDQQTVITAENMNAIQDELLRLGVSEGSLWNSVTSAGTKASNALDNEAAAYNYHLQYHVGDYCLYQQKLYRCTVETPAAGETWNSSHWTAVTVGDEMIETASELSELRNTLNHKADVIYDTASGDIASFPDGAEGLPVKDLTVGIEPVQDLHGYDHPWPGGGSANKIPDGTDTTNGYIDNCYLKNDGTTVSNDVVYISEYFTITASETYTLNRKGTTSANAPSLCFYDSNKAYISSVQYANTFPQTITAPSNAVYCRATQFKDGTLIQLELGSTPTEVVPYSNICPISGWTGANVSRTGKNLIYRVDYGYINSTGGISSGNNNCYTNYFRVVPGQKIAYSVKYIPNFESRTVAFYDRNKTYISRSRSQIYGRAGTALIYTVPANAYYCRCSINIVNSWSATNANFLFAETMVEYGDTKTAYEPYNSASATIPISWESEAGTVYGGTLDVTTGVLTVTDANIASYNGETLPGEWISDRDVYSVGATPTTGAQVVYKLATPQTYQLDPVTVTTLLGQNNIWADCGPSTVEYPADTKLYIQKINAPSDDDMIADANIASGQYFIVNNNLYISTAAILAGDPIKPGTNCTLTNLAAALNALNS